MKMASKMIDLNADLGEGAPFDAELMKIISSANIACGGHAGDADSMRSAIELALENKVKIGAHPSYLDRENFGRSVVNEPIQKTADDVTEQVLQLQKIAPELGAEISYVKLHGALYNECAKNEDLAIAVFTKLKQTCGVKYVLGPPNSFHEKACESIGLSFFAEVFSDRAYLPNGSLMPRSETGAVFHDVEQIAAQALKFAKGQPINTQGHSLLLPAQSICLHGDNQAALQAAQRIEDTLESNHIQIASFIN